MTCGACGFENPHAFKFCGECCAALGGSPASSERAPLDYPPQHLADRILRSQSALEGERKHVTVPAHQDLRRANHSWPFT